ncbi:MCE family protein [Mycobacterium sp. URHB0044]|jgi:phospholipid/cholesterol/gamma-HCH transport system substrate-binding protein|uniref:MCE family protein n=1 Tax=Mycobacterium sp. URHB0044 TaxID=1380386 RepID=UPI000491A112|nr:MCE family protein [Mycobacterium sp. URHB0044]
MRNPRYTRIGLAILLAVTLVAGLAMVFRSATGVGRVNVVAYFDNSNGVYVGDEVRILGVPVGKIESIQPEAERVKIAFWYDDKYKVPQDAKAVVIAPSLVSVRAIQLTPAYTGGPVLANNTSIGQDRTAVPVEFDDFRKQLERLTDTLQPTEPGGTSSLGSFVNTAADNLRGQGTNIRETLIKLSAAFSALGDNSKNLFGTIKNISILVSALQSSQDLMRNLNQNLAVTTGLLSDRPNELGSAVSDVDSVVGDVQKFVADNRESLGTATDKIGEVSTTLVQSLDDIKQALHVFPNSFQNFLNIYQPSQGAFTGALAVNQLANPIQFLCGAIQAASRLGAEQSAKLCVQYLAPIIKNRQYNFLPAGMNPFVGESARPNELTYSEDRLRPDYIPPTGAAPAQGGPALAAEAATPGAPGPLPPANLPFTKFGEPADPYHGDAPFVPARLPDPIPPGPVQDTDPNAGLSGLMVPGGAGS